MFHDGKESECLIHFSWQKIIYTPRELTFVTPSHEGLVRMMFLFNQVIFRFQPLVFRGVFGVEWNRCKKKRSDTPWLGGASKYFICSPRSLGKWSNLTSIFFRWLKTPPSWKFNKQNAPENQSEFVTFFQVIIGFLRVQGCPRGGG